MEMDSDLRPSPVPRPRVFNVVGVAPGPRCGHTLTAISGPEGDLSKAKLVLFGKCSVYCLFVNAVDCRWWLSLSSVLFARSGGATALEGSSKPDGAQSTPGAAASGRYQMASLR